MNTVNWLLINTADALFWLWDGVLALLATSFVALGTLLNPLLAPVFSLLDPLCTTVGDVVFHLLRPLPTWLGLTLISAVAGVAMLICFRYASNQEAIGRAKDDIKANLLALKLFKDELRVTFWSQVRLLWAVARLQKCMLTPVLLMMLPMVLGLAQMGVRYQWRPLRSGEQTLIRIRLAKLLERPGDATLEAGSGLTVEVAPVSCGPEIFWRVRAGEPGVHTLRFNVNGAAIKKELVVGDEFRRVSAMKPGSQWTAQLLHPIEPALPANSPVAGIEILYPGRDSWIHGSGYWVLYFFVISMTVALLLRPLFNVKF